MPVQKPEPAQTDRRAKRTVLVTGLEREVERCTQIRMLELEPDEPFLLPRVLQLRLRLLREPEKVRRVPRPHLCLVPRRELLEPVLPDHVEHPETRLRLLAAVDEAVVDQRRERLEHVSPADRLDRVERGAADEHGQLVEQLLLRRIEKPVAPVDRATHRLVALRRIARAGREQIKTARRPRE